jgi:acetate kinase
VAADFVLTLNAGSSTVKFAVFALCEARPTLHLRGIIEDVGRHPTLKLHAADGALIEDRDWPAAAAGWAPEAFAADILECVERRVGESRIRAAGHRIVHGGPDFAGPVRIDGEVLARLDALSALAPLHQPHNLAMVRAVVRLRPAWIHAACFDTGFFRDLPQTARRVPIPREWEARGVRRYGFHGLSYAYLSRRLAELKPVGEPRRVVFAHLGSGASLCACLDGAPVETTMGFSPLDGVVMSTRCGTIDPGVLLHLSRSAGLGADEIEDLLYHRSGLLGVSGVSGDMRDLLASPAPEAAEAVDLFVYRVVQQIGALAASLGGLDALVFSAGIGENSPEIRARVCQALEWMGVRLDPAANQAGPGEIGEPQSSVSVWVIPTDEEAILAEGAAGLVALQFAQG